MQQHDAAASEIDAMTRRGRSVLLVEDNDDHAELVRRALVLSGLPHDLTRVEDGEQALRYLLGAANGSGSAAACSLILLDLRLPRLGGIELLRSLRASGNFMLVPIIVLTTSAADSDIRAAYDNGAHAYVVKPTDFSSFGELVRDLARFWLDWNKTPASV
jgi:two-component system response regulator